MASLFNDLGIDVKLYISMHCDHLSTIAMTKNLLFHNKTKHIDICHQFIRNLIEDGFIIFYHYPSDDEIVDIFTKPLLPKDHFSYPQSQLRVQTLDI